MRGTGIILIVIGILMMMYTGYDYVTEKRVVDIGPIKVNKEETHPVRWSPVVGGILLIGGIAIVLSNKKKLS